MSTFAKKHNIATASFDFEIPEDFKFVDLKELVNINGIDCVYKVNGLYINNKGKFGGAPVIMGQNHLINAPSHLLDMAKDILSDQESVGLINRGYVGFTVYEYENQFGKQYSINWVDINPETWEDKEIPF